MHARNRILVREGLIKISFVEISTRVYTRTLLPVSRNLIALHSRFTHSPPPKPALAETRSKFQFTSQISFVNYITNPIHSYTPPLFHTSRRTQDPSLPTVKKEVAMKTIGIPLPRTHNFVNSCGERRLNCTAVAELFQARFTRRRRI